MKRLEHAPLIVFVVSCSTVLFLLLRRYSVNAADYITSGPVHDTESYDRLRESYLHVVSHSVTGMLLKTPGYQPGEGKEANLKNIGFQQHMREEGLDWPVLGLTMAGQLRMANVKELLERALKDGTPGDFVETGVWRGGTSIFARAVLHAHGVMDRKVHLVDSFAGLPRNTSPEDDGLWARLAYVAVPLADVTAGFERYGLLDSQVEFHKGFFRYSMPVFRAAAVAAGRNIAVLRMDGDMFESTMDVLFNAYDLVPVGGFVIVDDWKIEVCKRAILKFFEIHETDMEEVHEIDQIAMYWQKTKDFKLKSTWYQEFNASRGSE